MGNLFTSLLNSTGALQVYGRVFSAIQSNITNASTPGYAKQDQAIISMPFDPAAGQDGGVLAGGLISSRSQYLEQAVRNQQELLGSAQQKAADLAPVGSLFDTTGASGIPGAISTFFNNFSQLSVSPNDQASRQNVIDSAGQVAQAFQQNAIGITRAVNNVDSETRGAVDTINQIAGQIAEINKHYQSDSQSTQDAGLDAQLNNALESLSQVVHYTSIKNSDGAYSVYIGGQTPLVVGDHAYNISADFSTPQTVIRNAQGDDITSQLQNAGGTLGAMLQSKNVTLPGYTTTLNTIAQSFADTVNATLAQGVDRSGNAPTVNLFTYTAAQGAAATMGVTGITADQVAAALPAAPGGNGNALAMAQLATQPFVNGLTATQAYGNLGGRVGGDLAQAQDDQSVQQDLVNQAQQHRTTVSGVSIDEEAAKLLQFQQAYQAVGKMVGVLNSLTQTVMDMVK